jgi:hypothetical protein
MYCFSNLTFWGDSVDKTSTEAEARMGHWKIYPMYSDPRWRWLCQVRLNKGKMNLPMNNLEVRKLWFSSRLLGVAKLYLSHDHVYFHYLQLFPSSFSSFTLECAGSKTTIYCSNYCQKRPMWKLWIASSKNARERQKVWNKVILGAHRIRV